MARRRRRAPGTFVGRRCRPPAAPRFAWKRDERRAVAAVNCPSTADRARPKGTSLNSSDETSQPTAPTPSSRCPSSGLPSAPSADACRAHPPGRRQALALLKARQRPVRASAALVGGDAASTAAAGDHSRARGDAR